MRHLILVGITCVLISSVLGSYEGGYGSTHDHDDYYEPSYPAPPIVHPHHGHSAGSYYHYHVPLVGQQQHYQPSYHHDHSHYLWPLLLLLALPLLFLPLLPLLLLPLGISLLALLAPGGMMMMMMMMMMMGGGMMMRTDTISGRALNEMRTFGEILFVDMTSLLSKYARSLDLDQCPQRVACEMGAVLFPENNATDSSSTAKAFTSFIMEQYIPKGKVRRSIKQFEKAFWTGSTNLENCRAFTCQPTFKIYKGPTLDPETEKSRPSELLTSSTKFNETRSEASADKDFYGMKKQVNFVYPAHSKPSANDVNFSNSLDTEWKSTKNSAKLKHKRSHYSYNNYNPNSSSKLATESQGSKNYFQMFGTPTVQS